MQKAWRERKSVGVVGIDRRKFGTLFLTTLFVFLFAFSVSPGKAHAEQLTLGHTVPPSHVWHLVAERFGENLEKASGGKMKLRVVPRQQLGNEPQLFSMVQSGAIAFSILPAAFLANREESLMGWYLPYLFKNVEQAGAAVALPASGQMLKNLEPNAVVGIGYLFAGMRHVISVKPINSPEDLVNKKIRAFPSPIFNDFWLANGAAATALPLAEIAPSLTTNLLDAVDVDLDITVGLKYHQLAKYLTLTNHMAFPAVLFASKKWWDALPPADREMISKAFHEAEIYGIELQVKAEASNLEKLKADGAVVSEIDLAPFKEKAKEVTEKYVNKNELIKQFYNEVNESIK